MEPRRLKLRLFGPPEVLRDGTPVRLRTKKALALLAYLAAETGTHRRAELSSLLWPESDERRARTTLRSVLADLRSAFGSGNGREDSYLLVHRDSLGLGSMVEADLDLMTLRSAQGCARSLAGVARLEGGQRREVMERLREGATAYRGEFLEGFYLDDAPEFDSWASLEREGWRRRAEAVFDRLSQLELGSGEVGQAIATAERWTHHARTSEAAYLRLMEAYFAAGDGAAALRTFEACQQMLTEELGGEPSPETEALAARVRAEASSHNSVRHSQSFAPGPVKSVRGRLDAPFVGRSEEFGHLIREYHYAREGNPRAVVIAGEAGIGKTRLVEEFVRWAVSQDAEILRGAAFEATEGLPYGPWVVALRDRVDRERALGDLLDDVWLSELSRLLPGLREQHPCLPPLATEEATAKVRLFEAVAAFVAALARRKPVVVFIDDLQWADAATLDLLRYATQRWAEERVPVLLAMAARFETPEAKAQLTGRQASFSHDLPIRREVLGPLTEKDTVQFVQTWASPEQGNEPETRLVRFGGWLHDETGGQPLYLTETLSALIEQGILVPGEEPGRGWVVGTEAVPSGMIAVGVREAILSRLVRLGPDAFLLLAAAAILGRHADFEDLRRVVGLEEDPGLLALEEVLTSGLLQELPGGTYACAHDKIRDVIYTEVGGARRRVYHRRALEVLEEEGTPPAELARHALVAREDEAAFRYSVAAAEEALAVFALQDAKMHFGRARLLLEGHAPGGDTRRIGTPEERSRLLTGLGRVREANREWGEAQDAYEKMLTEAQQSGDQEAEWRALHRLVTLGSVEGRGLRPEEEDELYRRVRHERRSGEKGGYRRGVRSPAYATPEDFSWSLTVALTRAEKALSLAREMRCENLVAQSLAALGTLQAYVGRWERVLSTFEELTSSYSRTGNRLMESEFLRTYAYGLFMTGEHKEAVHRLRNHPGLTGEFGNREIYRADMHGLALALVESGNYEEALKVAREGMVAARSVGYVPRLWLNLLALGDALRALFGLWEAREIYHELASTVFPPEYRALVHSKLCAVAALAGDWEEAHAEAILATRYRGEATIQNTEALHRHLEVEALLRGSKGDLAREHLARFGEAVGENRRLRLAYLRALAVLRRWEGDGAAASKHLLEARGLAEEIELPGELWQIEASLGELYKDLDDITEAHRSYSRAAETLRQLADRTQDTDLRHQFLSATPVQYVMAAR